MHELSLASTMVDQVEALMRENGIDTLTSLTVVIGALSGVDPEAFRFAYPIAIEGSQLEGSRLCIEEQPVEVTCASCGARTSPDPLDLRCTACQSREVKVVSGREFLIQSLEYTGQGKTLAR